MQLFIISLVRSTSRREEVLRNPLGDIQHQFFDAIDASAGQHLSVSRYDEDGAIRRFGLPLLPGEVGCFASHYTLWRHCVSIGRPIAIMEDDVTVTPHFVEAFGLAAQHIEACRFIRLAGLKERAFSTVRQLTERHSLVRFRRGPMGTQCYCLSPRGAALLLQGAERWTQPVDLYIDSFWRHGVASLAILPFEARESDEQASETTIAGREVRRGGWAKYRREADRLSQTVQRLVYNATHRDG